MSDFSWHRGEPPKDGKDYLVLSPRPWSAERELVISQVRWDKYTNSWKGAFQYLERDPVAWTEIPPMDWDALEEE